MDGKNTGNFSRQTARSDRAVRAGKDSYIAQNDWQNALNDLNNLQNLADLGGTRVPGGTNKAEIVFLKGFALENLNRYAEAIDVYLSIPDGRNEYYGWRATERLKALARDEKAQFFTVAKIGRTGEKYRNQKCRSSEKSRASRFANN